MPVDALGDLAARLLADAEISAETGGQVFIDLPFDPEREEPLLGAGNKPFIYFGEQFETPASDCGGFSCRLRIYVESFAANRLEAHALMRKVIAAIDARYGADDFDGFDPSVTQSGDVLNPFSPFGRYADIQWSE